MGKSESVAEVVSTDHALLDSEFSTLPQANLNTPAHFWVKVEGYDFVGLLTYKVSPTSKHFSHSIPADWISEPVNAIANGDQNLDNIGGDKKDLSDDDNVYQILQEDQSREH